MRRLSAPVDDTLFKEFDKKVPHGIKATLIRGLVRIALSSTPQTMWDIAANENEPELFEIRKK